MPLRPCLLRVIFFTSTLYHNGLQRKELASALRRLDLSAADGEHMKRTESIAGALNTNGKETISKNIVMAAGLRKFLG